MEPHRPTDTYVLLPPEDITSPYSEQHGGELSLSHHANANSETRLPATNSSSNHRHARCEEEENLPWLEIHRSRRTQGIMAGLWRGQNLRKTVGECEMEVGRHKHMHETRQSSSVLLQGTDAPVPECCLLYRWKDGSLSSVLTLQSCRRSAVPRALLLR